MNAFEQCLDMQPASPQGFPSRWTIAFAALVATIAGNRIPTLLAPHRLRRAVIQMRHHLDDITWQDLACRLLWILPGGGSQLHQAYRHGGKQSQERAQTFIILEVALLDLATRFESLMKILHHPACTKI